MMNEILNLNKKNQIKSRRDFFKSVGTFFCVISVPIVSNAKKMDKINESEFVMLDGWVLKKEDLHDI